MAEREPDLIDMLSAVFGPPKEIPGLTDQGEPGDIIAFFGDAISVYTVHDGIADGVLVPILAHRWQELTGGKAIVATATVAAEFSVAAIMEMFNEWVLWRNRRDFEDRWDRFQTTMNFQKVYVQENADAITIFFPSDD